ncbi:MAG: hypothetical protein ACRDNO_26985 [Trebonia sp.]
MKTLGRLQYHCSATAHGGLCRAAAWQRDGDAWRVLLRWGVAGQPLGSWYLYDPEKVSAAGPA